ncbi:hypothetical protein NEIMUCOT_06586 [Neisseria mucosa ATCC 25996]|uniref:Uncharacterized protein n=1 Tax=Neisseria mucosa (strain ATCC 25996 / DSM 4631 / NCTC 10774 / M26) TaxID=546266 RepID=D3A0Z5_NEIM2|nr:hypothetical protein NEIMUCOT_06586 [Neisseria mucosa ATCC 25996]
MELVGRKERGRLKPLFWGPVQFSDDLVAFRYSKFIIASIRHYSGLNLNQDKATKLQTLQIVRKGETTPYWFKFNLL